MKSLLYTLLIAVIFVLSHNVTYGQAFPSLGTTWYYEVNPWVGCLPCPISFQKMECTGDTLINGISCRKLHKSGTATPCSDFETNAEYVYTLNNKVYWYNAYLGSFTILYDFNANTGDSWDITVYDCSFTVVVDSVTISSYNGISRKNIFISDYKNYFTGKIIANIGHMNHFFPQDIYSFCKYHAFCDSDFADGLRCFSDTYTGLLNFTDISCDSIYYVSIQDQELSKNLIEIYPNPCSGRFYLSINEKLNGQEKNHFELYRNDGKKILNNNITDQKTYINLSNYPRGIYLLRTVFNNKVQSKIIILK